MNGEPPPDVHRPPLATRARRALSTVPLGGGSRLLLLGGGVLTVCAALSFWLGRPHATSAPPADAPDEPRVVQALGRLEPGRGVVNLNAPEGLRVHELHAAAGQTVRAGDRLGCLETYPEAVADRELAEKDLADGRALLEAETLRGNALIAEAEEGLRHAREVLPLEVVTREARLSTADADFELTRIEFDRARLLQGRGAGTEEDLQRKEMLHRRATEMRATARGELSTARAERDLGLRQAEAKLATARAELLRAQRALQLDTRAARVAQAEARVERALLRAPVDGRVLRVFTYPGERVGTRPVLQMGETARMYAVAEVYETDVRFVRVGQRATVSSPALERDLTGVVEEVGLRIFKNDVLSVDPRSDADTRVVEVRVRLDQPEPAARMVFLQVHVRIDLDGPARRWGEGP